MIEQLRHVDSRRLYQKIADQIRGLIEIGSYPAGARLPPERDLATQLGVSRPSLREALIALEIDGSVEIRMGAGVYVCSQPAGGKRPVPVMGESPVELMQARVVLEGAVAMMACARATPETLSGLQDTIEGMRAAIAEDRPPQSHDRQFHLNLATMTGNNVLIRLVGELFDERHSPISLQLSMRAESSQTWTEALDEHQVIVRALESRDVVGAHNAMCRHLSRSQDRWTERSRREWS